MKPLFLVATCSVGATHEASLPRLEELAHKHGVRRILDPRAYDGPQQLSTGGPSANAQRWESTMLSAFGVFNRSNLVQSARASSPECLASPSTIRVVATSPGKWSPTLDCPAPRLWVLLYGQHRSFDSTKRNLATFSALSSRGCYFVAAVAPDSTGSDAKASHFAGGVNVSSQLLDAQSSIFNESLAFVTVARTGMFERNCSLQGLLDFFWWGSFVLADSAAVFHGLAPDPASVVLRTRFDVDYDTPYALEGLSEYFRHGERGRHLAFGQEGPHSQADWHLVTSFGAYRSDIAGAYEREWYRLARSNAWGFGVSVCGWKQECSDQTMGGPSLDLSPECQASGKDPYGEACCPSPGKWPCMLTVVQGQEHDNSFIRRGNSTEVRTFENAPIDLAKDFYVYCPTSQLSFGIGIKRKNYYLLNYGGQFFKNKAPAGLSSARVGGGLWPKGC